MAAYAAIFLSMALTMEQNKITPASLRFAAMNLLAMREHSAKELHNKLEQKFPETHGVEQVVRDLTADGLQSDDRFAQAFVNMRKRQGKGPLIINMELRERGITGELISESVGSSDVSWHQLALSVKQKKFGTSAPVDAKEKAKQIRFLAARGFASASIQYALKNHGED